MSNLSQDYVKELFVYDKGRLKWRKDKGRVKKGSLAGCISSNGYTVVRIDGVQYKAHRIIYLYFHGYIPECIDHKYGANIGDYIWNLRPATRLQNAHNRKISKNNRTGVKGVYYNKSKNRFEGTVTYRRTIYLVSPSRNISDVERRVKEKRLELHGEFANHG